MEERAIERYDLQEAIDKALAEMASEAGVERLEPGEVNLAELQRRTGLTRSKACTLKEHGFKVVPHGRTGRKEPVTVMSGHEHVADELLSKGVTNSSVVFDRLRDDGYEGSLTSVKRYIAAHRDLAPAKRRLVAPQGNRGRRFETAPGEACQMDRGFVKVRDWTGEERRCACFAMVCHRCGTCYVEFFPNARQECLFIGMVHAFQVLGVPDHVLTDNMASVVTRRDLDGRPVWQRDYAAFMSAVGFKTRLCKPRHPYTKGKVERLVRFARDNLLAGRELCDLTGPDREALAWCAEQSNRRRALALVPAEGRASECLPRTRELEVDDEVSMCLCPRGRISFDGFVSYEGCRLGVPYRYGKRECRVSREGETLHI